MDKELFNQLKNASDVNKINKNTDLYLDESKNRLRKIFEKKIKTSFIGALAKFEEFFGQIWGHGKKDSECTKEQIKLKNLWEKCRTEVLNNGNNQLRAIELELHQYEIDWLRYKLKLGVIGNVKE